MNTLELNCILNSDPIMKGFSPQVLAIDKFVEFPLKERGLVICNSQSSDKLGEHWFLIFYKDVKEIYFIDSFAKSPEQYGLNEKFSTRKVFSLSSSLQNTLSTVCGEFCVYFAFNLCRNIPLRKCLEPFSENKSLNGLIVRRFIKKVFPGHDRVYLEDIFRL